LSLPLDFEYIRASIYFVSRQHGEAALGWYLRKSVKVGPFRVNFSKSGIGYSFGVKGARIGTGPHGAYIAGGRGGIYYRQSLTTNPSPTPPSSTSQPILATSAHCYCAHCGATVMPGNEFCTQCGTRVMPDSVTAQVAPLPEETHDHHLSWLLLGGAVIFLVFLRSLASLDSTKPETPSPSSTSTAAPIARPAVSFRVEQNTRGEPITVWLGSGVSDQQVRDVVRYFKSEIQGQRFADLGINAPTFIHQPQHEGDHSAGIVVFYRELVMKRTAPQRKGSRVAEYKWGIDGNFQKDSGRLWIDANHTAKLF
jgi:hypothetical protein